MNSEMIPKTTLGREGLEVSALAWLLSKGDSIVPIPGTKRIERVKKNLGALRVQLTEKEMAEIERISPKGSAAGGRF